MILSFCVEYLFLIFCICVQEMAAEVSAALSQRDPNLVLSAAFKLYITQRDLATLEEGCCLNDEVGFMYLIGLM